MIRRGKGMKRLRHGMVKRMEEWDRGIECETVDSEAEGEKDRQMEVFWWNGRWKKGEEIEIYSGRMDGKMDGRWSYRIVDWKVTNLQQWKYMMAEVCRYGLMGWRVKMMGG